MSIKERSGAEKFWYAVLCVCLGSGYFSKVPLKKAMSEYGMCEMTGGEKFWYVVQCICFGAGYFRKVVYKKGMSESNG